MSACFMVYLIFDLAAVGSELMTDMTKLWPEQLYS